MAFAFLNRILGLNKILGRSDPREALRPLYDAIIVEARTEDWYRAGQVPDTQDGRFDLLCHVTALVVLRLETMGEPASAPMALLTEVFVADMEGQMRETGYGDVVVGKQVGKMMSALGGRLGACRTALAPGGDMPAALTRNLYRGDVPEPGALDVAIKRTLALVERLKAGSLESLLQGEIAS
jgi:cytochrome b pre-mRNA-processing protein 3